MLPLNVVRTASTLSCFQTTAKPNTISSFSPPRIEEKIRYPVTSHLLWTCRMLMTTLQFLLKRWITKYCTKSHIMKFHYVIDTKIIQNYRRAAKTFYHKIFSFGNTVTAQGELLHNQGFWTSGFTVAKRNGASQVFIWSSKPGYWASYHLSNLLLPDAICPKHVCVFSKFQDIWHKTAIYAVYLPQQISIYPLPCDYLPQFSPSHHPSVGHIYGIFFGKDYSGHKYVSKDGGIETIFLKKFHLNLACSETSIFNFTAISGDTSRRSSDRRGYRTSLRFRRGSRNSGGRYVQDNV